MLDFLQNNKGLGEVGGDRGKTKLLISIIIDAGGRHMRVHYTYTIYKIYFLKANKQISLLSYSPQNCGFSFVFFLPFEI